MIERIERLTGIRAENLIFACGFFTALLVWIAPPVAYVTANDAAQTAEMEAIAEVNARHLSHMVGQGGGLWRFQTERMKPMLERRPSNGAREVRRVLIDGDKVLAVSADELTPPVYVVAAPITDAGTVVGRLEVVRSRADTLKNGALVALASGLLALVTLIVAGWWPMEFLRAKAGEVAKARELAEELVARRKDEDAAKALKSVCMGNIGHELRTPLNGVIGMMDLALDGNLCEEKRDLLEVAHNQAWHLARLIERMEQFAAIEAGLVKLHPVAIELDETLEDVLDEFRAQAEKKGLALGTKVEHGTDTALIGAGDQLRRVLRMLLDNAIKFSSRGKIVVLAATWEREGELSWTHVAVRDEGVGIAPDRLRAIFEPYLQADGGSSRGFEGIGLGLAIAHGLVRQMGGRIWAINNPDGGSTFNIMLPLTRQYGSNPKNSTPRAPAEDVARHGALGAAS